MFVPPLLSDGEVAYLQSLHPLLEIKPPTAQMRNAMIYYLSGYSVSKAASEAGYTQAAPLNNYLASESGKAVMQYLRENQFKDVRIDRDIITTMLLDAHSRSANTTEEVMAIRELAKIHDLYPNERRRTDVNVSINMPTSSKQLSRMGDEELLKLATPRLRDLLSPPEPVAVEVDHEDAVDGDFTEGELMPYDAELDL